MSQDFWLLETTCNTLVLVELLLGMVLLDVWWLETMCNTLVLV